MHNVFVAHRLIGIAHAIHLILDVAEETEIVKLHFVLPLLQRNRANEVPIIDTLYL